MQGESAIVKRLQGFTLAQYPIAFIRRHSQVGFGQLQSLHAFPGGGRAVHHVQKTFIARTRSELQPRIVRRTFLLPMAVLAVGSILLAWLVSHLLGLTNWVDHTDRVIAQARTCEKLAVDMETGLRGYLITGDPSLMQPFNEAEAQMGNEVSSLEEQVSDNSFQAERVETIRRSYGQWLSYAQDMLGRRQRGEDYQSLPLNAQGKAYMDTVRSEFSAFVKDEYVLRDERISAVQRIDRNIKRLRWIVLLVIGLGIGWYVRQQLGEVARIYESGADNG